MWNDARQESPLVGLPRAVEAARSQQIFRLQEKPFLELVNLRGDVRSPQFSTAVETALGISLPSIPNTVSQGPAHTLMWLGPDEWLLQSASPRQPALERTLRPLLAGQFANVVDVSSGYTVIELSGSRARDVLQKGCPLDLHPRVFGVGLCAQSHFFKASIVLRPIAGNAYELVVRRSFADYAARMLLDAAVDA